MADKHKAGFGIIPSTSKPAFYFLVVALGLVMDPVQFDLYHLGRRAAASRGRKGRMEERKRYRGFGEDRRKAAKLELLRVMESVGQSEGKTRALAIFSLRSGHTVKRAEEYLGELVDAGLIEIEGEVVTSTTPVQPKEEKAP